MGSPLPTVIASSCASAALQLFVGVLGGALESGARLTCASWFSDLLEPARAGAAALRRRFGISSLSPVFSATLPTRRAAGPGRGGSVPSSKAPARRPDGGCPPSPARGRGPAPARPPPPVRSLRRAGRRRWRLPEMPPRTWPMPAVARARLRPTRSTLASGPASPPPSSAWPCSRSGSTASETRAGPTTAWTPGSLAILRCQRLNASSRVGLGDRPVVGGGDDDEGRFEAGADRAGEQFAVDAGGVVLVELLGARRPGLQRQRRAGEDAGRPRRSRAPPAAGGAARRRPAAISPERSAAGAAAEFASGRGWGRAG